MGRQCCSHPEFGLDGGAAPTSVVRKMFGAARAVGVAVCQALVCHRPARVLIFEFAREVNQAAESSAQVTVARARGRIQYC